MSCSDVTAFVGETRDGEGGQIYLEQISTTQTSATIIVTTPWGSTEQLKNIALNEQLLLYKNGEIYTIKLTNIEYSELRNEYFCIFDICYESRTEINTWGIEDNNSSDVFGDDWGASIRKIYPILTKKPLITDKIYIDFKAKITTNGTEFNWDLFGAYIYINGVGGGSDELKTWSMVKVEGNIFKWYRLTLPADINGNGIVDWIEGINTLQIENWSNYNSRPGKTGVDIIKLTDPALTGSINCSPTTAPISSIPPQIFLDGNNTMLYAPHVFTGISPGSHRIDYYLTGYKSCGVDVTVTAGQTAQASCTLERATGILNCMSTPTEARITIGTTNYGLTNRNIDLYIGDYDVTFSKEGYEDYKDTKTILADRTTYMAKTLIQKFTSIKCTSEPQGANITLDNNPTIFLTPHTFTNVAVGNHKVDYYKTGYNPCSVDITVSEYETANAFCNLDLIETGTITTDKEFYQQDEEVQINWSNVNFDGKLEIRDSSNRLIKSKGVSTTEGSYIYRLQHDAVIGNWSVVLLFGEIEIDKVDFTVGVTQVPGFDINVYILGLPPNQDLRLSEVIKIPFTDIWYNPPLVSGLYWNNISNDKFKARELTEDCRPIPAAFHGLVQGKHYAIYAGDPVVAFHPQERIFELTSTTTDIPITNLAELPIYLSKLCSLLDVPEIECATSFYTAIPDVLFSAEDLSIIIDGKSIYPPYAEKDPTGWNYLFAGLTFIPGSGVIKGVGKAGVKAVKSAKLYPDAVQNLIRNGRWQSAWYPEKQLTFLEVMWDLTGAHLDEVVAKLEIGDADGASALITKYLPEKPTADLCVKNLGDFTKELFNKLPFEVPEKLIKEAGLESSFVNNAGKVIYAKSPPTATALSTIDELYNTLPRAKELFVDDIGRTLSDMDALPEQIERVVNAASNYPSVVYDLGKKTPLSDIDELVKNAVDKLGYENTFILTDRLFSSSLKKTLEAPNPIQFTVHATDAIVNIIENDPKGFTNALLEFDLPFRLKFIKSMELSGAGGLKALRETEGAADIARHEDIYNTFGIHIHDVIDAYTDSHTTMPEYWSKLGIDSIDFAADGKIIEDTPPYLTRYLAELAESKLSREVAEELVHKSLMKDSISQIIYKDFIGNDELLSLHELYVRYPIAAGNALKEIAPTDLAKFVNILERTDEGKFISEIFRVREELVERLGVNAADEMLDFWMVQLRTVVDEASRKSFLKRLSDEVLAYPGKHPAKFIVMLISAVAGPIGLAEFILWRMKETLWDIPSFNLHKAVQQEDKTTALEMLDTFKYLIEKYEPMFRLISYATPFSVTMVPDYIMNTKLTHDLYAEILGVPEQKFFRNDYLIPESIEGTVSEMMDGDTVKADFEVMGLPEKGATSAEDSTIYKHNTLALTIGGTFETGILELGVRFLGINTPEDHLYDYSCTDVREPFLVRRLTTPGQACISEELWHTDQENYNSTKVWIGQNLPRGQTATFKSDQSDQFDKHRRLLAVPIYNSKNVCIESLKTGQSAVFFYDENKQVNQTDFLSAEKIASDANIGIWPFAQEPEKTGWIKFISDPTAAEVYLDGTYIGKTVSNVLLWETTLGLHDYEFKKFGYIGCQGTTSEITETHTESNPYEKTCTLEPEEEPCPNPNGSFAVSNTTPKVGEPVTFNATASTPGEDQSIDSYDWNFGDGTTASGMIVTHSFATAGLFVVKLDVENNCGESDPTPPTKNITVSEITENPATWEIGSATDQAGNILSAAKVYVDDTYIGHYAPETLKFCTGCTCDTIVPCGFGEHTVTVKKTRYGDWSNTRTLSTGDSFTDNPIMEPVFEIEIDSIPDGAIIKVDGETVTTSLNLIQQLLLEQK